MRKMKKLFCILLCLCLLTACGASLDHNPYFIDIRNQIQGSEKPFGVAYLGTVEGDYDAVQNFIDGQEYVKNYPFLQEIPEKSFIQNEGNELYCVIPADEHVTLSVYKAEMSSESVLQKGEQLITVKNGQPILVRGNISDITPNLMIVAKSGDAVTEFVPCLSLQNGTMDNSEQKIYEFSPYELMAQFNGWDPTVEWDFYGDWVCKVSEFNGDVVDLKLSISPDGVEYSFQGETMTGSYHGHWMVISDGRIRMEFGGSTQDSKMPGATGLHTDVDGIYRWDVKDGSLVLTYLNGTPFYPAATVTEYQFVPVK